MPSVYTHYKHDELGDKILIRSWKKTGESRFVHPCIERMPFMFYRDPGNSWYCYKCGKPLNVKQLKAFEHQGWQQRGCSK